MIKPFSMTKISPTDESDESYTKYVFAFHHMLTVLQINI